MHILNLTPHPLTLRSSDGTDHVLVPSGVIARVSSTPGGLSSIPGVPVPVATAPTYGEVVGLPDSQPDAILIVSSMVLGRLSGRRDVFAPGTGPGDEPVRDTAGRIVAVTRLIACP